MPFVLILTFVVILGFILTGVTRLATSAELSRGMDPEFTNPYFDSNWTVISPEAGYLVTSEDVIDEVGKPTYDDPFIYTDLEDNDDKYVHVVRDNAQYVEGSVDIYTKYQDFIVVRRNSLEPGSVGGEWFNAVIPLTEFANPDNWDNSTNKSTVQFQLGKSLDALFIVTTNTTGADISAGVWSDSYELFYGWSNWRIEDIGLSEAIGMALWADIPGVHWLVNYIVHAFVYATIIFVVFTMITRIIPFIGD
jgi:hypothetical protein